MKKKNKIVIEKHIRMQQNLYACILFFSASVSFFSAKCVFNAKTQLSLGKFPSCQTIPLIKYRNHTFNSPGIDLRSVNEDTVYSC